jgi:hypothetical protein
MSKLPAPGITFHSAQTQKEASDMVSGLIERNLELEEVHQALQPLLYALSTKLYTSDEPVTLSKLVEDSVEWINKGELQ